MKIDLHEQSAYDTYHVDREVIQPRKGAVIISQPASQNYASHSSINLQTLLEASTHAGRPPEQARKTRLLYRDYPWIQGRATNRICSSLDA